MKVKFKKLHQDAQTPTRGSFGAAGYDLTATSINEANGFVIVGCGLAFEIPPAYVGLLYSRSGIAKKDLILSNCVGVIDSDYRGEVMAKFRVMPQHEGFPNYYEVGERFAQFMIVPAYTIDFEESESLSDTERGAGGYGSTGK